MSSHRNGSLIGWIVNPSPSFKDPFVRIRGTWRTDRLSSSGASSDARLHHKTSVVLLFSVCSQQSAFTTARDSNHGGGPPVHTALDIRRTHRFTTSQPRESKKTKAPGKQTGVGTPPRCSRGASHLNTSSPRLPIKNHPLRLHQLKPFHIAIHHHLRRRRQSRVRRLSPARVATVAGKT